MIYLSAVCNIHQSILEVIFGIIQVAERSCFSDVKLVYII